MIIYAPLAFHSSGRCNVLTRGLPMVAIRGGLSLGNVFSKWLEVDSSKFTKKRANVQCAQTCSVKRLEIPSASEVAAARLAVAAPPYRYQTVVAKA
jgi:hypothetical protein